MLQYLLNLCILDHFSIYSCLNYRLKNINFSDAVTFTILTAVIPRIFKGCNQLLFYFFPFRIFKRYFYYFLELQYLLDAPENKYQFSGRSFNTEAYSQNQFLVVDPTSTENENQFHGKHTVPKWETAYSNENTSQAQTEICSGKRDIITPTKTTGHEIRCQKVAILDPASIKTYAGFSNLQSISPDKHHKERINQENASPNINTNKRSKNYSLMDTKKMKTKVAKIDIYNTQEIVPPLNINTQRHTNRITPRRLFNKQDTNRSNIPPSLILTERSVKMTKYPSNRELSSNSNETAQSLKKGSSSGKQSSRNYLSKKTEQTKIEIEQLKAELQDLIDKNKSKQQNDQINYEEKHIDIRKSDNLVTPHTDERKEYSPNSVHDTNSIKGTYNFQVDNSPKHIKKKPLSSSVSSLKTESPTRVKNYDPKQAREYIKKQKQQRRNKLIEEINAKKRLQEEKRRKLKELQEKTLKILANKKKPNAKKAIENTCKNSEFQSNRSDKNQIETNISSQIELSVDKISCHNLDKPPTISNHSMLLHDDKIVPSDLKLSPNLNDAPNSNSQLLCDPSNAVSTCHNDEFKQMNAAIKIQSVYRGYKQRKRYLNILNLIKGNSKTKSTAETETQTNLIDEHSRKETDRDTPLWLKPAVTLTYPFNFINAVKQKINFALHGSSVHENIFETHSFSNVDSYRPSTFKSETTEMSKIYGPSIDKTDQQINKKVSDIEYSVDFNSIDIHSNIESSNSNSIKVNSHSNIVCSRDEPVEKTSDEIISSAHKNTDSNTSKILSLDFPINQSDNESKEFVDGKNPISSIVEDLKLDLRGINSDTTQISQDLTLSDNEIRNIIHTLSQRKRSSKTSKSRSARSNKISNTQISSSITNKEQISPSGGSINTNSTGRDVESAILSYSDRNVSCSPKVLVPTESKYSSIPYEKSTQKSETSLISEDVKKSTDSDSSSKHLTAAQMLVTPSDKLDVDNILKTKLFSNETDISDVESSIKHLKKTELHPNVTLRDHQRGEYTSVNVQRKQNEICLKFQAEFRILDSFNESLRRIQEMNKVCLPIPEHKRTQTSPLSNSTKTNRKSESIVENLNNIVESINRSIQSIQSHSTEVQSNKTDSKPSTDMSSIKYKISEVMDEVSAKTSYNSLAKENIERVDPIMTTSLEISKIGESFSSELDATLVSISEETRKASLNDLPGITVDIIEQQIRNEDAQLEHFKMLLKIREKSLIDRTKGELAWLEMTKKQLRSNGELEKASAVKKKQRGILLKLQQEKHEMQRLKQMHIASAQERKIMLKEQKTMIKKQLSTKEMLTRFKRYKPAEQKRSGPVKVYSLQNTSESVIDSADRSVSVSEEISLRSSRTVTSERKSRSEISSLDFRKSITLKTNNQIINTDHFKQILQKREKDLKKRRETVEELLEWHRKLSEEESRIVVLEQEVKSLAKNTADSFTLKGTQLNKLWRKVTGNREEKYSPDEVYIMTKHDLDMFYETAKQEVFKKIFVMTRSNSAMSAMQQLESSSTNVSDEHILSDEAKTYKSTDENSEYTETQMVINEEISDDVHVEENLNADKTISEIDLNSANSLKNKGKLSDDDLNKTISEVTVSNESVLGSNVSNTSDKIIEINKLPLENFVHSTKNISEIEIPQLINPEIDTSFVNEIPDHENNILISNEYDNDILIRSKNSSIDGRESSLDKHTTIESDFSSISKEQGLKNSDSLSYLNSGIKDISEAALSQTVQNVSMKCNIYNEDLDNSPSKIKHTTEILNEFPIPASNSDVTQNTTVSSKSSDISEHVHLSESETASENKQKLLKNTDDICEKEENIPKTASEVSIEQDVSKDASLKDDCSKQYSENTKNHSSEDVSIKSLTESISKHSNNEVCSLNMSLMSSLSNIKSINSACETPVPDAKNSISNYNTCKLPAEDCSSELDRTDAAHAYIFKQIDNKVDSNENNEELLINEYINDVETNENLNVDELNISTQIPDIVKSHIEAKKSSETKSTRKFSEKVSDKSDNILEFQDALLPSEKISSQVNENENDFDGVLSEIEECITDNKDIKSSLELSHLSAAKTFINKGVDSFDDSEHINKFVTDCQLIKSPSKSNLDVKYAESENSGSAKSNDSKIKTIEGIDLNEVFNLHSPINYEEKNSTDSFVSVALSKDLKPVTESGNNSYINISWDKSQCNNISDQEKYNESFKSISTESKTSSNSSNLIDISSNIESNFNLDSQSPNENKSENESQSITLKDDKITSDVKSESIKSDSYSEDSVSEKISECSEISESCAKEIDSAHLEIENKLKFEQNQLKNNESNMCTYTIESPKITSKPCELEIESEHVMEEKSDVSVKNEKLNDIKLKDFISNDTFGIKSESHKESNANVENEFFEEKYFNFNEISNDFYNEEFSNKSNKDYMSEIVNINNSEILSNDTFITDLKKIESKNKCEINETENHEVAEYNNESHKSSNISNKDNEEYRVTETASKTEGANKLKSSNENTKHIKDNLKNIEDITFILPSDSNETMLDNISLANENLSIFESIQSSDPNIIEDGSEINVISYEESIAEDLILKNDTSSSSDNSQVSGNDSVHSSGDSSISGSLDVRKRVREILADASQIKNGQKSPRVQDLWVTTYDVIPTSPEQSPESASPIKEVPTTTLPCVNESIVSEAEELRRKQLEIEQEIKELEKQQNDTLPFMYVREIPNKPPPPYTPPSPQPIQSPPKNEIVPILMQTKTVSTIVSEIADNLYNIYSESNINLEPSNSLFSTGNYSEIDSSLKSFLFDLCKDVIQENLLEPNENVPSWCKEKTRKNIKRAKSRSDFVETIDEKVKQLLGLSVINRKENLIICWSRKKRDHVDELLVRELQVEEAEWTNFDNDEISVKNELTDDIFDHLIADTVSVTAIAIEKKLEKLTSL